MVGSPGEVCFAASAASSAFRCDSVRKLCEKSEELAFRASNSALVRIALDGLQPAESTQELLRDSSIREVQHTEDAATKHRLRGGRRCLHGNQ